MKRIVIAALALSGILWAANPNSINASNYKQLTKGWSDFNIYILGSALLNRIESCTMDGKSANCKIASTAKYDSKLTITAKENIKNLYTRGLTIWLSENTIIKNLYRPEDRPWEHAQYQGKVQNQYNITDAEWKINNRWPISESNFRSMNMNLTKYEVKDPNPYAATSTIKNNFTNFIGSGTINFAPGEYYVGSFTTSADTKMKFTTPGKATILHTNGYVYWNHSNINNSNDREKVAKGFILIHHGTQPIYISNDFYGTIVAPHAEVNFNTGTKFYGTIVSKTLNINAILNIKHVKFAPSNF